MLLLLIFLLFCNIKKSAISKGGEIKKDRKTPLQNITLTQSQEKCMGGSWLIEKRK